MKKKKDCGLAPQGADSSPPLPLSAMKAGRNHFNR